MSLESQASLSWLLPLAVMLSPLSSQAYSGMCISSSLSDSACVTVAELMMAQEGEHLMGGGQPDSGPTLWSFEGFFEVPFI